MKREEIYELMRSLAIGESVEIPLHLRTGFRTASSCLIKSGIHHSIKRISADKCCVRRIEKGQGDTTRLYTGGYRKKRSESQLDRIERKLEDILNILSTTH